jgi:hypothetical protein
MDPWADRKRDYSGNVIEQLETLGNDLALERVKLRYSGGVMYQISHYSPGGSQHSNAGKDEADARAAWARLLEKPRCRECGDPEPFEYDGDTARQLAERGLCFFCNLMVNWMAQRGPGSAVIDGHRYEIEPDRPKGARDFCGLGGAEFVIEFNDGRSVTTTNLWACGEVPAHFRERVPDNARFAKRARASAYVGHGSATP